MTQEQITSDTELLGVNLATKTMGKDLLGFIIQELKVLPKSWQQLGEHEQTEVLDRAKERVENLIATAIGIIFANGCVSVIADIEGVAIKDHIKVSLKVSRTNSSESMQELFSAHNQPCRIVLATAMNYTAGMHEVKGQADQGELALDDGDELIGEAITFVRQSNKTSISALQRHLRIGYNRAARIIEAMEKIQVVSGMAPNGSREVL
ncbi:MAG: DNA translocase FtsK [Pseudomonadota bacterium]